MTGAGGARESSAWAERGGRGAAALAECLRASGSVFAEDEARLLIDEARGDAAVLEGLVRRRVGGEPLEQVVGWAEFAGLRIALEPGVFVPRRRTRALVDEAVRFLERMPRAPRPAAVLDLCCGAGAIGAAIAAAQGERGRMIRLVAADLDPAAVRAARRNLAPVGALVVEGDLYEPVPASLRGSLDLITANAPYVPTDEIAGMPPEARDHEPLRALDGGADGLDVQRRVLAEASGWLRPGGRVLVETSRRQAAATAAAAEAAGLAARVVRDERVDGTVVVGTLRVVSVGSAGPVGSADAVGGDGAAGGVEDGGGQRPAAAASTRATSSSAT